MLLCQTMKITPDLFHANLKCPTKCWLRAKAEPPSGNPYAEWVKTQTESYRARETMKLVAGAAAGELPAPVTGESLKAAKWQVVPNVVVQAQMDSSELEASLHVLERVASEGRGKAAQFVPIRFIFTNKLGKDDKLLLAFDALALSEALGREVRIGKIIHGDDHATLNVKTSALVGEARKRTEKITALLSSDVPPDLVLNRHCGECEFQARCRKIAIEKDDLSLLAGMSAKERKKLRSKGIFTVTQLSYTFRPRRRPKRQSDKREKYHHSLKALAIREKKIHIVGSPELKIEGTPVYLDVEGLPDRDFYYLIGVRIGNGDVAIQHSLWADTLVDEGKIWREFLAILETVEKPVLIHYGSYETNFLQRMNDSHGGPIKDSLVAKAIESAVNAIPVLFAQIYFPTFSNGLKDIADCLGFKWSEVEPAGSKTIIWRNAWEESKSPHLRERLSTYNAEDCQALETLVCAIQTLGASGSADNPMEGWQASAVHTESIERKMPWRKFTSSIAEFETINNAAQWDYQRDRVHVRGHSKRIRRRPGRPKNGEPCLDRVNKVIVYEGELRCPQCHATACRQTVTRSRIVRDLKFGTGTLKRWIVEYRFCYCWCGKCKLRFGEPSVFRIGMKCGWNLIAFVVYEIIELRITQTVIQKSLARLFGFQLNLFAVAKIKDRSADYYKDTQAKILERIARGGLVHVDETRANIKGKIGYVWVFTNLHEVVYLYSDSREGEIAQASLSGFNGVLVSDFYAAYDSFACPQQKCLIHLMRDLNDEMLDRPFDEELRRIAMGFADILKPMVETVDRYGLKKHFLKKHLRSVERFYKQIEKADLQSDAATKCKDRFEKNRSKLFTFLEHDGIPWNNNNAEHAVKAFAVLRDVMRGSSTQKGLEDYLVLLSVCQTCKYMGVDFLDFLRSGEKDIHAFAESRRGRKRRAQASQPADLPAEVIAESAASPDAPVAS